MNQVKDYAIFYTTGDQGIAEALNEKLREVNKDESQLEGKVVETMSVM